MKINWGNIRRKLVRVFFPNNTWQYQGFIYNIRTTSNIKKKGHFYKKVHLKFHHPMFKKFYNKINLCWYFIRVGPKVRCTFSVGLSLNMSQFNILVVSLNLKIQKSFATHHIWILSLTGLFNLQISICLKCLVLNTGVILWSQPLTKVLLHNILDLSIYQFHSKLSQQWCHLLPQFSGGILQILESTLKWESWKKFIQGNLNLREELDTFLVLKDFFFQDAWMFLFGIKSKNVLFCKDLCCVKTNIRSLIILMN